MKHTIIFISLILLLASCIEKEKSQSISKPKDIVVAAHYFASEWPKTFWQEFEEKDVEGDFQQIKNDGFNTLIFVVPWVGFETNFNQDMTTSNPWMYKRLSFLVEKAVQLGFNYILRVGFPHDFTPETGTNIIQLCTNIYTDEAYKKKWKDFLKKIYEATKKYRNNSDGILVSWEDFWCPHFVLPNLPINNRIKLAQDIGYSEWLLSQDTNKVKLILGVNELDESQIAIPSKEEMSYLYYLEYIDMKFDELILNSTKEIFPEAAMEIRVDKDPILNSSGKTVWIEHDLHFDEENHRGTYWAPFWGAQNKGELLSAKESLANFEYFLKTVTNSNQSNNHVIEQFNFTDNTPYFPNNAEINSNEIDEFLLDTVPLLKKYSSGYGLWAYRDYADNGLYNSSFEYGLHGWDISGDVELIENTGENKIKLSKDSQISQLYNPFERHMLFSSYKELIFCLDSEQEANLTLLLNEKEKKLELKEGNSCHTVDISKQEKTTHFKFKVTSDEDIIIDNMKLYGFVQRLKVYDEFGKESLYLDSIRKMNKELIGNVE